MVIYTLLAAIAGIVAGIVIAFRTKKAEGVTYGKLDKAGIVTNVLLTAGYTVLAPFYMFIGAISESGEEGILGILGWVIAIICASAAVFCSLGLGFSVALRRKGNSKLSFLVQFAGVVGIVLSFALYVLFEGTLLASLN